MEKQTKQSNTFSSYDARSLVEKHREELLVKVQDNLDAGMYAWENNIIPCIKKQAMEGKCEAKWLLNKKDLDVLPALELIASERGFSFYPPTPSEIKLGSIYLPDYVDFMIEWASSGD